MILLHLVAEPVYGVIEVGGARGPVHVSDDFQITSGLELKFFQSLECAGDKVFVREHEGVGTLGGGLVEHQADDVVRQVGGGARKLEQPVRFYLKTLFEEMV